MKLWNDLVVNTKPCQRAGWQNHSNQRENSLLGRGKQAELLSYHPSRAGQRIRGRAADGRVHVVTHHLRGTCRNGGGREMLGCRKHKKSLVSAKPYKTAV